VQGRNLISGGMVSAGSTARYRGLLAATTGQWSEGQRLLSQAARENRAAGAPILALRSELDLARVGLQQPAALEAALVLLEKVSRAATLEGAPGIVAEAERLRRQHAASAPPARPETRPAALRREGEYWTIELDGVSLRLRDTLGLHYLARLIAEPGRELSAMELAGGSVAATVEQPQGLSHEGDLGPLLDARARAELGRRLAELELLLDTAAPDPVRAERLRKERDAIGSMLGAAAGIGGRERRIGDPADRARQSVTKAIKATIVRIAREHQVLGQHLASAVRTGFSCRYEADPLFALDWRVSR
jgi:hypothetical protein